MIALWRAGATIAFNHALALPLVEPFLAGIAALAAMVGYRFIVADKDRRLLQKSFALYLAPHVIERMLASNKLPRTRRRDPQRDGVLLRHRRIFADRGEDVARTT